MNKFGKLKDSEIREVANNIRKDKDFNDMDNTDFENLVASIKEAQTIMAKMKKAKAEDEKDFQSAQIRKELKLSQEEFCNFIE